MPESAPRLPFALVLLAAAVASGLTFVLIPLVLPRDVADPTVVARDSAIVVFTVLVTVVPVKLLLRRERRHFVIAALVGVGVAAVAFGLVWLVVAALRGDARGAAISAASCAFVVVLVDALFRRRQLVA